MFRVTNFSLDRACALIRFPFSYQRTLHRNLSYLTQFDMSQSHHPNTLPVCFLNGWSVSYIESI